MKIGSYSFLSMDGNIGAFGEVVEDETRPGIHGHTFRKLGKRGDRFGLVTKQTFSSIHLAKTAITDYGTLQCTFQVVEDALGNSYRKVIIHSVHSKLIQIGSSTDGHSYMVEATWVMQRAG